VPLRPGSPAPNFKGRTHSRPDYTFNRVGGLFVLMAFLPADPDASARALAMVRNHRRLFDDRTRLFFGVTGDQAFFDAQTQQLPGLRYFFDDDGAIAGGFGLKPAEQGYEGQWVVLDPGLRVLISAPLSQADWVFGFLAGCKSQDDHAGVPLHAPVLIVPRILEPALCRELIAVYKTHGGSASGVMRKVDGQVRLVVDDFKKRSDAPIDDEELRKRLRARITACLLPEIEKAFMFKATRIERYIVASYDESDGGYFRPHRDNTTPGTAHRQFACSINLNAEEFDGGDLRFPEFGRRTYRPPTGGAVIFSCSLVHEATPVTRGTRYAFLPFFYNEDGARIRQANLKAAAEVASSDPAVPEPSSSQTNPVSPP
jgi:predicted 2-oxoglutarate/Fe(II)-dependent dioxygenase YbiX